MTIKQEIQQLTDKIVDAQSKPHLRPVITASLRSFGQYTYTEEDIEGAMDDFFKAPTLQ